MKAQLRDVQQQLSALEQSLQRENQQKPYVPQQIASMESEMQQNKTLLNTRESELSSLSLELEIVKNEYREFFREDNYDKMSAKELDDLSILTNFARTLPVFVKKGVTKPLNVHQIELVTQLGRQ